jgi:hypothetical protein
MNNRANKFNPKKITNTKITNTKITNTKITDILFHIFSTAILTAILAVLDTDAMQFGQIMIVADNKRFIRLISQFTDDVQDLYILIWSMVHKKNSQFLKLDEILKSPFKSSKHTQDVISLQKCLFNFIKKTKNLTTQMINFKQIRSLFAELDSVATNLLDYSENKDYFIPTHSKRGFDVIYRSSKPNNIIHPVETITESSSDDENPIKHSPSLPTYNTEYYHEIYKPYMDERNADATYSDDEHSDDEYSCSDDDYEEMLRNMGHAYLV